VINLDDEASYALDRHGMFEHIEASGPGLLQSWDACENMRLPAGSNRAASVVIAGMGGSATAGDYFATLCQETAAIPVMVVRGPVLPNFVSEQTLVVIASHSGNTEETLSAYQDASRRGATIWVVTTGGRLAQCAVEDGVALHVFRSEAPPRTAMAQGLAPLLQLGRRTGIFRVTRADIVRASEAHARFAAENSRVVPSAENRAKRIASALSGRLPLVLGGGHLAAAGSRFKNQLAENGKMLGAADTFPEAGHNLIVGLGTGGVARDMLALVALNPGARWGELRRKSETFLAMFAELGIPVESIVVEEAAVLDDLIIATAWGDYVSYFASIANSQDPTPIPQIERIKNA
jgi:glucose/mannose-6-phosphate isomerase